MSCSAAPARRCGPFSGADHIARVLVTRPQPLAGETAARLTALGHDVLVAPLLEPVAVDWQPPDDAVEALIFTSPQGPRFAGSAAQAYRSKPVYAVGERTAAAARDAGFHDVQAVDGGNAVSLFSAVAARHRHVLHLAGTDRTAVTLPSGLEVVVRAVYDARLRSLTDEAAAALRLGDLDWALLFSTRTAGHFAALFDALGADRARLSVAAISVAALEAAGAGWRHAIAAVTPTEAGILAACGLSCDKSAPAEER